MLFGVRLRRGVGDPVPTDDDRAVSAPSPSFAVRCLPVARGVRGVLAGLSDDPPDSGDTTLELCAESRQAFVCATGSVVLKGVDDRDRHGRLGYMEAG